MQVRKGGGFGVSMENSEFRDVMAVVYEVGEFVKNPVPKNFGKLKAVYERILNPRKNNWHKCRGCGKIIPSSNHYYCATCWSFRTELGLESGDGPECCHPSEVEEILA